MLLDRPSILHSICLINSILQNVCWNPGNMPSMLQALTSGMTPDPEIWVITLCWCFVEPWWVDFLLRFLARITSPFRKMGMLPGICNGNAAWFLFFIFCYFYYCFISFSPLFYLGTYQSHWKLISVIIIMENQTGK